MKQIVIENPVINSPFDEPARHFRFTDEGITNEVIDGRRSSSYFVPIARPRKKGQKQLEFDTEWTQDRIEEVPVGYRTAVVMGFDPNGCECLPDDPRNCYWLYIVTNCGSNPILQ